MIRQGNLLALRVAEYHSPDIGSVLEALAKTEEELGLVQAKLRSFQETVNDYRSSDPHKVKEIIQEHAFKQSSDSN